MTGKVKDRLIIALAIVILAQLFYIIWLKVNHRLDMNALGFGLVIQHKRTIVAWMEADFRGDQLIENRLKAIEINQRKD